MTGQQLRNSILQEAIQGRLVPNVLEPGEKTGAELRQAILAEIQNKKKEGKRKKAEKLALPVVEEEPWELPIGWCWCVLPEVATIEYGFPFDSTKFNNSGQGMPLIRIRDVVPGRTKTFTTETVASAYVVHKGDMLTGMDGNFNVNFWNASDAYLNQRVCKITSNKQVLEQRYLFYYLPVAFKEIEEGVSFVTVKHLSDKILKALTIPLPPLSVQKAIVKKIDELFPIIDEYDKAAGELETLNKILPDKLRKSILQEAIHGNLVPNDIPDGEATGTELLQQILKKRQDRENKEKGKKAKKLTLSTIEEEPWDLPIGWCWCKLGDLFYKVTDGTHSTPKYMPCGVPFLSVKDISKGRIDFSSTKYISIEEHTELIKRCEPKRGDLLLTKVGTTGIPVIVDTDKEFSLFVSVALCKHIDGYYNLRYILNAINSPFIQGKIAEDTLGAANKNWVIDKIMNTTIPLPPLSIQHRIVEKIEEAFVAIDKLNA